MFEDIKGINSAKIMTTGRMINSETNSPPSEVSTQ